MIENNRYKLHHSDHSLTDKHIEHVYKEVLEPSDTTRFIVQDGSFFIIRFEIEQGVLPPMENALYGESQGETLNEKEVFLMERGDRGLKNRMIHRSMKLCWHGIAIGVRKDDDFVEFYTIHGGDLAEKHPDTCEGKEKERAIAFWAKHALATGKSMVELKVTEHYAISTIKKEYTKTETRTTSHNWFKIPLNIDMDIEEQVLKLFPTMINFKWREIE